MHTHFYDRTYRIEKTLCCIKVPTFKPRFKRSEQRLIEKGVTPSIFFRFPGLIADEGLMRALRERYFLIPFPPMRGSQNQRLENGSLILIHGNKNEPLGIDIRTHASDR